VDTKLKTGIAEGLREPLMRIAQQLLISDKNTFEQLTPTEKQLWTTFKTADIYRFLTGEEDTVSEFQYNWTTVPRLQPLDSNQHLIHSCKHCSSSRSSSAWTTSRLSTKLSSKHVNCPKQSALIANTIHFRYQA
jgi:hypothetical protein